MSKNYKINKLRVKQHQHHHPPRQTLPTGKENLSSRCTSILITSQTLPSVEGTLPSRGSPDQLPALWFILSAQPAHPPSSQKPSSWNRGRPVGPPSEPLAAARCARQKSCCRPDDTLGKGTCDLPLPGPPSPSPTSHCSRGGAQGQKVGEGAAGWASVLQDEDRAPRAISC